MNYTEQHIDQYLNGEMSELEKQNFLNAVEGNPDLKDKLNFQSSIVDGIRQARVADLKNRLADIPVSYQPGLLESMASLKTGATLLLTAGAISVGAYLYFDNKDAVDEVSVDQIEVVDETVNEEMASPTELKEISAAESNADREELKTSGSIPAEIEEKVEIVEEMTTDLSDPVIEEKEYMEEAFVPEVVDAFDDEMNVPSASLIEKKENKTNLADTKPSVSIEKVQDGTHNFHYRYFNNKLFLYGSFDRSPYELLELNKMGEKELFLYYDGDYYSIEKGTEDIKSLPEIKDSRTKKKLESIRSKK